MLKFVIFFVYVVYAFIGLTWVAILSLSVPFGADLVLFSIIVIGMAFAVHFAVHIMALKKMGVQFKRPKDIPIDDLGGYVEQKRLHKRNFTEMQKIRRRIEQRG